MNYRTLLVTLWKHKFPILVGVAGSVLISTQLIDILVLPVPTFFEKTWLGLGLGVFYLIVAGIYEWTIRVHERTQKRLQRKREMIEEIDFSEGQ